MSNVEAEKGMSEPAKHRCLEGKVAIVTGGGRGIGRAIAETLATHGASVSVSARTRTEIAETVRDIQSRGGRATAIVADVSADKEVRRMCRETQRRLGPPDILVKIGRAHV